MQIKLPKLEILLGAVAVPLFLFFLNTFLVWPLFFVDYSANMYSIESAFIADAKFILDNFPNLSWNPYWYAGFPFQFTYPPAFIYILAFFSKIFSWLSIARVYHILTAFFYVLGPISLYFLVKHFTKKILPSLISAFSYSILPSTIYLFSLIFLKDNGISAINYLFSSSVENGLPRTLDVLIKFGEGPHISALALIPLVLILFHKAISQRSFISYVLASFGVALIFLWNIPSSIALVIMAGAVSFSQMMIAKDSFYPIKRTFWIFVTSFGLVTFFYTFSYVTTTIRVAFERGGGEGPGVYFKLFILFSFVLPIILGLLFNFFSKKAKRQLLAAALISLFVFSFIVLSWYWFKKIFIPEPNRFMSELSMIVPILIGLGVGTFYEKIRSKWSRILGYVFLGVVLVTIIFYSRVFLANSWNHIKELSDIKVRSEYQIAKWLEENTKGERVYATGSTGFWLNVFTDQPQIRGGADQSATNPWWNHASYQIFWGEDSSLAIKWLQAFNASYIVVNFPESQDVYKDYRFPKKFEGTLEKVYEGRGDAIYKVPLVNPSLAQTVKKEKFLEIKVPRKGDDLERIAEYVNWVEDPEGSDLEFEWLNNKEAVIKGSLGNNEAINIQITYDPGWRAWINGNGVNIQKDPIGFMYIDSDFSGEFDLVIKHVKAWDVWLGYAVTAFTLIALAFLVLSRKFKKQS